jgi:hypothetical protein
MRIGKALWLLGFLGLLGCTTHAPPPAIASATTPAVPRKAEAAPFPPATAGAPLQGDETKRAELVKARTSFETFISHADGRPEYATAVAKAKERIEDIDRILIFMDGGTAAP